MVARSALVRVGSFGDMRRPQLGVVRVGVNVHDGTSRQYVQPRVSQFFGHGMRSNKAVRGWHTDMCHKVGSPSGMPKTQFVHMVESTNPFRGMFEFVPQIRIAVVKQAQDHLAAGLVGGPTDQHPDRQADCRIDPGLIQHDADCCGHDTE